MTEQPLSILKACLTRAKRAANAMRATIPPYEFVQAVVESGFHEFIHRRPTDIRTIVVVGGFHGDELPALRRLYGQATIHVFEPVPETAKGLRSRFNGARWLTIVEAAVSDTDGEAIFRDTNRAGSGSLLPLSQAASRDYGLEVVKEFQVRVVRLDTYAKHAEITSIDLLWIDVQGAEAVVLAGAGHLLERAAAVMCEVAAYDPMYEGAPLLADLDQHLRKQGLVSVMIGCDPINGTGNALWISPPNRRGKDAQSR